MRSDVAGAAREKDRRHQAKRYNNWLNVGGVNGGGGMMSSTKGGPLDTPVSFGGNTYCAVQQGWKLRGRVNISGATNTIPVSFAGNIS